MQHTGVQTDTGPFALVPEWVLDAPISDRAIRLYAVLGRYADQAGRAYPSRRTLAERLRCSAESIDRALRELRAAGAVRIDRREREDGSLTSSLYTLVRSSPETIGTRTADEGGTRTGDDTRTRTTRNETETSPSVRSQARAAPVTVDRRAVTDEEREAALHVLGTFNDLAGTSFRSAEWLAKIIRRMREYPEATVADHEAVIRVALADPWWRGPATPSVVYGNAAQFERSVQAVRVKLAEGDDDERLARIVKDATTRGDQA